LERSDHENRSYNDIGRCFWAFWLAGFGDADDRDGFDSGTGWGPDV